MGCCHNRCACRLALDVEALHPLGHTMPMTPDAAGRPERSDLTVDQHRMVAPSRVWLMPPPGDPTWYAGSWKSNPLTVVVGDVPYVPESALRAAEAERDAVQSEMATWRMIAQGNGERARLGDAMLVEERAENAALRARVAALEAEREALVPLAQAGLAAFDYAMAKEQYGM